MNSHRWLAIPALLTLALLASGGRAHSRRSTYPANPCIVDDARFQSSYGGCYDSTTHLVWSMNAGNPQRIGGIFDYPYATSYAANLVEGGTTGWRLPTLAELRAIAGVPAMTHLNVFFNSNVQNPDGTYGGYGDALVYSSTAAKGGPCKSVVAVTLKTGAESNWGTKAWPNACSSATDFVCVRRAP